MEFRFEFLPCLDCKSKDFCDRCESYLAEKLLLEPEIQYVSLQMPGKNLSVSSNLDFPKLEELLRKYEVIVR